MKGNNSVKTSILFFLNVFFTILFFSGCTIVQKYQKNVPFIFKNNIKLKANGVSKDEKVSIKSKLTTQLDDSAKVIVKDKFFVFHYLPNPPVFDTNAVAQSAANMTVALQNL
jgi:outer membrane protein insertion porin family